MKICTNLSFSKNDSSTDDYPYSTEIPRYNLLEGSEENWTSLNSVFNNFSWENILHSHDLNPEVIDKNIDAFIKEI